MRNPTLTLICLALLAAPAIAQEPTPPDREAEIKQLQAMLERVDSALALLKPVVAPKMVMRQYDIRHILFKPIDRAAPRLTIPSPNAGFRTGAGSGGFSFEDESEYSEAVLDPDQIETILINTIGEDHWDDPASIEMHNGYLFVTQTEVAHARIAHFLAGQKRQLTRSIQLEVGFYALPPALQRKVEAAALTSKGSLSPRLLAELDGAVANGDAQLTGSAMLTALNEQRVYLHNGGERAFVSGFERSSGGAEGMMATVADPVVEVLRTGLALDMRATLSGEGSRPRVSMDVSFVRTRPTELAKSRTPWGTIDMPRVSVDSVRTSARVPSGGGMLVFSARASKDEAQPDVTIIVRPLVIGN